MVLGYSRISTADQTTEAQLPDLKKAGCRKIYQETMSGRTTDRPELEKSLERLEERDTLIVWRLDRLGRSLRDLLEVAARLENQGVIFISLKERFDTGTPAASSSFFVSLTQFERELIRAHTLSGLSMARARGKTVGRKPKLSPQQARVVRTLWASREHTAKAIAEQFGMSVSTIERAVRPKSLKL